MNRPELLAPVGNKECLDAAIMAGCDAIYLSGKKYGARVFATNFSDAEIVDAINYAHLYGVKVYVTVNTIIYEEEVDDFISYVEFLHKNNVDAIIMQDIGMIDLVRKVFPNLEIHVSTQGHVHNIEGVKFFEKLGIKRVVLARETSLSDIKKIKEECSTHIEAFVHGALCISYSGECLMSSLIGGRSGNRGACCGSCRLPYDLISNNKKVNNAKYLLSTKDLMTLEHVGELIESGIDSFKIEGRMKRPSYVYLVVSLYRKAIDSYLKDGVVDISKDDIYELKKIFNRGFTEGYLFDNYDIVNQNRPNHMGVTIGNVVSYKNGYVYVKLSSQLNINDGIRIVGKYDVGLTISKMFVNKKVVSSAYSGDIVSFKCDLVDKNSKVLKTTDYNQINNITNLINNKSRKVFINGCINVKVSEPLYLELSDGVNFVSVSGDIVSASLNRSVTRDDIVKQIDRLGNSVYTFKKIHVIMDDNCFVPVSVLNKLRRDALALLDQKRCYSIPFTKCDYYIDVPDFSRNNYFAALVSDIDSYNKLDRKYDYIYVDEYSLYKKIKNNNVFFKVPRVNYDYIDISDKVLVGEVGSLSYYKLCDSDFSFNVVNSYSVAFLHSVGVEKITLSYELDDKQINDIISAYNLRYSKHPNLEVIIYGREEVMVSKFNLLKYYNVSNGFLKDRFGNLFPIKISNDLMYIYNYKLRKLDYQKYFDMGVNSVRFNF